MARTHYVKSRRVGKKGEYVLTCQTCHKPIEYGTPYKYFTMKKSYGGVKKSYHEGCAIPPSHRTTSRMGEIWDAQEQVNIPEGEPGEISDLEAEAQSFAEVVRSVAEGYEESSDNMESGFGHATYASDELRERADSLNSWADDLESIDFEEFDDSEQPEIEREVREDEEQSRPEDESDEDFEERVSEEVDRRMDEKRDEWWSEQCDKLQSELDNCPC